MEDNASILPGANSQRPSHVPMDLHAVRGSDLDAKTLTPNCLGSNPSPNMHRLCTLGKPFTSLNISVFIKWEGQELGKITPIMHGEHGLPDRNERDKEAEKTE